VASEVIDAIIARYAAPVTPAEGTET